VSQGRPLRILFAVEGGTLLRFSLLLPGLTDRGHHVQIGFINEPPPRALALADDLKERSPLVTYGLAPRRRKSEGWYRVARAVRLLADLAHHAHPRYEHAPVLRRRMTSAVLKELRNPKALEPAGRMLALRLASRLSARPDASRARSAIRRMAALEDAIPTSPVVDEYLRRSRPDVVLATGTFRRASEEVELVKSARRLGIPTGVCVPSWDNLTNKGLLKYPADRIFVWNDVQLDELAELHHVAPDRVRPTGAHAFDEWFERTPARTREEFAGQVGLDPSRPYLVYLCSSRNIARGKEVMFVRRWLEALRAACDEPTASIGALVRPHPNFGREWRGVDLGVENAVVWPPRGVHPVESEARADFFDSLAYSAAAVGANTTAMIEAAILGKSVLTVLVPEFAQETTLHFGYLLAENGGFLHLASSLEEHVDQVRHVLDDDTEGVAMRRRFVRSFVRPAGLEQQAVPVLVGAIEELAKLPADRDKTRDRRLLTLALGLEAALTEAYLRRRSRSRARSRRPGLEHRPRLGR